MSHLAPLIADLALILICAGIMTLLFKKLKQPLVLGYVVAGFLASPHMAYTPSVMDTANIQTWADIGVIFLLFALGLEFSFKKIVKVGGAAIIAACTIIFCMILLGVTVGTGFGWKRMDCIFLGGMIAMSSTTIIYKAFDDLGMRKKQFTGLVLSVLILEDILAIVLMVMLSTIAVSHNFECTEMLGSIAKLLFFLILWFVVGIYLIPGLLKRCRKLMSEETLLIVSLGLCFGMVVMAAHTGFSAAFGAFIMGSILAETVEAESIERLVKPVKDLFGAIFFVSVGMMVDPAMIVEYAGPIVVITLAVILGQSLFGTLGVLLAGQPLKTAMQCGFSLTQIGEFAFILAGMGLALGVMDKDAQNLVLAGAIVSIMLNPVLFSLLDKYLGKTETIEEQLLEETLEEETQIPVDICGHAVIVGYGRVGGMLADKLRRREIPLVVIEDTRARFEELAENGFCAILGNGASKDILSLARIECAKSLLLTIPNGYEAGEIVATAKELNPALTVVVRAHYDDEVSFIKERGADHIIIGEHEIAKSITTLMCNDVAEFGCAIPEDNDGNNGEGKNLDEYLKPSH